MVNCLIDGLVDSLTVSENFSNLYNIANLGLAGSVLGTAIQTDANGTNASALGVLFTSLTYSLYGSSGTDTHLPATSPEGLSLILTNGAVYESSTAMKPSRPDLPQNRLMVAKGLIA